MQNGRATKPVNAESGSLLVVELIAAYLNFLKSYYRVIDHNASTLRIPGSIFEF